MRKAEKKIRLNSDGVPYAICPKCKIEIHYLLESIIPERTNKVYPDKRDAFLENRGRKREYVKIPPSYEYRCPICHSVIAENPYEAEALFYEDEN